jgi:hypothetical protein
MKLTDEQLSLLLGDQDDGILICYLYNSVWDFLDSYDIFPAGLPYRWHWTVDEFLRELEKVGVA